MSRFVAPWAVGGILDEHHHQDAHNWWVEPPWPMASASYSQLAWMVVTGLRDGFRITDPTTLAYTAWNENAGNRALDRPMLGLALHE
jgi:hypothetical protein